MYQNSHSKISSEISGFTYTDEQIAETLADTYKKTGYLFDPHGAVGYRSLLEGLKPDEIGVFLETAHPAKFKETVELIINAKVSIPAKLAAFMKGTKSTIKMTVSFNAFKKFLMNE